MQDCLECEKEFTPNTKVSTLMCLDCSIDVNAMVLKRYTSIDGSIQHRKLLKRKQMLLSLKGAVPFYKGGEQFNQVCKGCGVEFVTKASFKDRVYHCTDCQRLRATISGVGR